MSDLNSLSTMQVVGISAFPLSIIVIGAGFALSFKRPHLARGRHRRPSRLRGGHRG